ncbi:MAG: protein translocase subunit SecD, partial [Crenarchaeota archaeon]|nr:protein translocase subunit SecD [Thermoproteota archaeon]
VMEAVKQKIEWRVNAYGVTEPIVQTVQNEYGNFILVQLPGVKDTNEAMKLIGQTAQLDFREQELDAEGKPMLDDDGNPKWVIAKGLSPDGTEIELTGKYLKPNSQVGLDQMNQPEVEFEWNSTGAAVFEQVTTRNLNKPLGIFLDNEMISAPTVQAIIKEKGRITGLTTLSVAKTLSLQLNSGSLDAPLTVVERRDIGATLGSDALNKSLIAGIIGVALMILYMCIFYRVSGVVACLALLMFAVLNLAVFKLIPVTLTLSGIAGFFVSLGMGVDGNVLVAERLKEELRAGHSLGSAVELAFRESWTAIWDSNVTVFIACIVLYWLGGRFGNFMVVGFATTLFIGTALSMFTQVTVTRTLLRVTVNSGIAPSSSAYGVYGK